MSKATWTPRRFARRRVWRIIIAACATLAACGAGFIVNQRKSIALEVDGKTKQVTTYAASLPEFLKQQHITIQSHDQAQSQSGYWLSNDDIVRVRKAYEVMLNIDGHIVPYWTYANSAAQLEQYFHQNDQEASKVSVDIPNVYNELSGGILLDTTGNVQVVANGKTSTVNGNQTVASILDSEGVNVGPDTLVSVQHRNNQTVLMVQKVSYATVTKTVNIAFNVQTVMDPNLYQGTTVIRQQGVQGSQTQTLKLTYLDGKQYSEQLLKSVINKPAVNEIIALGTKKKPVAQTASGSSNASSSDAPQVVAQGTVSTQQTAAAAAQKAAAAQAAAERLPRPLRRRRPNRKPLPRLRRRPRRRRQPKRPPLRPLLKRLPRPPRRRKPPLRPLLKRLPRPPRRRKPLNRLRRRKPNRRPPPRLRRRRPNRKPQSRRPPKLPRLRRRPRRRRQPKRPLSAPPPRPRRRRPPPKRRPRPQRTFPAS